MNNTNITLSGNTEFTHNRACGNHVAGVCDPGGGIIAPDSNLTFTGNTTFLDNGATFFGNGGAISTSGRTVLSFNGTNNFINNSADDGGGAISTNSNTTLRMKICHE